MLKAAHGRTKKIKDIFKRDLQKEEAQNIYVRTFRCSPSKQLHEKNQVEAFN